MTHDPKWINALTECNILSSKCHCKTPNGFAHKHCEFQDDSYAFVSPKTKDIFKTKISEYRMFHLGKVSHHASQIVFGRSLRFETGAPLMREETRSSFNLLRLMFAPFTSDLIDGLFSGCMLFLTRLFNLGVFRI